MQIRRNYIPSCTHELDWFQNTFELAANKKYLGATFSILEKQVDLKYDTFLSNYIT